MVLLEYLAFVSQVARWFFNILSPEPTEFDQGEEIALFVLPLSINAMHCFPQKWMHFVTFLMISLFLLIVLLCRFQFALI